MNEHKDLMDPHEAADYLSLNEQTVRRLARARTIPAFKVGGVWRFRKAELERWNGHTPRGAHHTGHEKILVIDDEPQMGVVVRRILEPRGYTVLTATDGPAGLSLLAEQPDLIYLDLMMPGMLGPEVLRHIRQQMPRVAVVILTAYPDSTLMSEALLYSPITLLAKPFTSEQLVDTTVQILRGSTAFCSNPSAGEPVGAFR